MAGQNHFLPGTSDAFYSHFDAKEEYERRFIKIPMARTLDPVTGSNLKRRLQRDNLLRRKWHKQQHKRMPSKTARPINGPKITSCCRAESQEHAAWRKICEELIEKYRSSDVYFNQ